MDLFVYSDESGVLDYIHNDYYVFGGLLLIGKEAKDIAVRKYIAAEKVIEKNYKKGTELKATNISNSEKGKLYRSLNQHYKFAVIVKQQQINKNIFNEKKSKQRYLDYVYKIGLKALLKKLIAKKIINENEVKNIRIFADEHTTATDGKYELREGLLQEYKYGTFNETYNIFYNPIMPHIQNIEVNYCNSATTTLVRAADIIANRVYYLAISNKIDELKGNDNLVVTILP